MADEMETGGAGPRIESKEQFAQWMQEAHPRADICVALAVRASLRALPNIIYARTTRPTAESVSKIASGVLPAIAVSRIVAKYPNSILKFRDNLAAAQPRVTIAAANAASPAKEAAFSVVHTAKAAELFYVRSFYTDKFSASGTRDASLRAVEDATLAILSAVADEATITGSNASGRERKVITNSVNYSINSAEKSIWLATEKDVRFILSGASACQLADTHLWHGTPSAFVSTSCGKLAAALPDTDGWWVWKNWYEDCLNGTTHNEAHELIYATVPDEEWDKGPAAANKWIAERLKELDKNTSPPDINIDGFPKPLENIPSLFTFGLNDAGQIDVVAGPQNTPVIGFAGDEATHRQWLETARELARRLATDLRAENFGNVRRDYADGLVRYAGDLPIEIGEGNFLLADHEIIAIHDLFGAEAAILPEALAARLNRVLKAHYSLLDFYPETKRYHEAAQTGLHGPQAPEEAFAGFERVVREFTPEIFAPRVTQELEAANYVAPRVEIDEEDSRLHAAIEPAPYPYEHDSLNERNYERASTINAIWKPLYYLLKNPDKTESYLNLLEKCRPLIEQILNFITS